MRTVKILLLFIFVLCFAFSAEAAVVKVKKSVDGWRLLVDGKPFFVKGMAYEADKIGESANELTLRDWAVVDDDKDGRIDAPYQSWVDKNRNNIKDPDEKEVGDFQLLKDMGCNTIRIYHHSSDNPELLKINANLALTGHAPNKALYRELYQNYGIRIMMGDLIGAYTVASGADWQKGTDYQDPVQRANMLRSIEVMVNDFKDEPYILLWALGNENDFVQWTNNNSKEHPEDYLKFVNEVAARIHQLDPNHPVCLVNGDMDFLKNYIQLIPDVDILGFNIYRPFDFGDLWDRVAKQYGKPVLLTEFGTGFPPVEKIKGVFDMREDKQAATHRNCWKDIEAHAAGKMSPGNSLGAFVFVWIDSWWHDGNPWAQDVDVVIYQHEWHGMMSQGNGKGSPLVRQIRKVYGTYKELWNEKSVGKK